jgi:hypothetical protein
MRGYVIKDPGEQQDLGWAAANNGVEVRIAGFLINGAGDEGKGAGSGASISACESKDVVQNFGRQVLHRWSN